MDPQLAITQPDTRTALDARQRYEIDTAHANAQFRVRHLMIAWVRGALGPVTGRVLLDPSDVTRSEVLAFVDTTLLDTRHADRDAHLRSGDFLATERFPTIAFRSTRVERTFDGLRVTGELTIRGVTREEALAVELTDDVVDPWGDTKRGITARTRISRKDYGLTWNVALEAGGLAVGDEVDVTLELEVIRRDARRG